MVKILKFKPKQNPTIVKLIRASMEIDGILIKYLNETDIEAKEIAGSLREGFEEAS